MQFNTVFLKDLLLDFMNQLKVILCLRISHIADEIAVLFRNHGIAYALAAIADPVNQLPCIHSLGVAEHASAGRIIQRLGSHSALSSVFHQI